MIVRKILIGFGVALAGCAASEQQRPEPDGVVVLEVPSAVASSSSVKTTAAVAASAAGPLDIEGCISKTRQDPFPGGPVDPSGGELYLAGLAAETRGDTDVARKRYFELIQSFKSSPYVPLGYFAFGEMFRAELGSDPTKLAFAEQSYAETSKYPPAQNPLYEIALLRKAELSAMSGDGMKVLDALLKLAQSRPTSPCASELRRTMENMLAPAFASAGAPEKAAVFFAPFGTPEFAASATARLARLYITQQKGKDAIAALRGLANSTLTPGTAMCGEAMQVAQELGDAGVLRDLTAKCKR